VLNRGTFTASSSIVQNYDKYILSSDPIRAFVDKCLEQDCICEGHTKKIIESLHYGIF
jgi:hypothetical protein